MRDFERDWKKLQYEIIYNKPQIDGPYPQNIVENRELLLYAQIELGKAQTAYNLNNEKLYKLHFLLYSLFMNYYYK